MPAPVSQRVLRALSLAFHVALPLLLLGLLLTLPLLERWAQYPWFLGAVALVTATAAAAASVLAFRRTMRDGRLSDVLLATAFGAAAATYTFGAIATLTGAANTLAPHDLVARLVLGAVLVAAVRARRHAPWSDAPDARTRALYAAGAFVAIEAVLGASALLGAAGVGVETRGAGQGVPPVDPAALVDVASAALFVLAVVALLAEPAPSRPRTAAVAGAALFAVGTIVVLLARPGHVDVAVGHLGIATACVASAAGLLGPRRETEQVIDRISVLASHLDDGIFVFGADRALRWLNAAGAALAGIPRRADGMAASDVFGSDVAVAELARAAAGGQPPRTYVDVDAAPGSGRPLALAISAIRVADDPHGDLALVVARDTSTQRQDAQELERVSDELTAALVERDELRRSLEVVQAEHERVTTRDLETGVANEQAILDRLRSDVAQARRYPHPLAVVLVEIRTATSLPVDSEEAADADAEPAGEAGEADAPADEVEPARPDEREPGAAGTLPVREVALRLQLRLRLGDALGRVGERRFLLVLPHTDEHGAQALADAIRARVGGEPIRTDATATRVEVGIGIAVLRPGIELSPEDLVARAESRLAHEDADDRGPQDRDAARAASADAIQDAGA